MTVITGSKVYAAKKMVDQFFSVQIFVLRTFWGVTRRQESLPQRVFSSIFFSASYFFSNWRTCIKYTPKILTPTSWLLGNRKQNKTKFLWCLANIRSLLWKRELLSLWPLYLDYALRITLWISSGVKSCKCKWEIWWYGLFPILHSVHRARTAGLPGIYSNCCLINRYPGSQKIN